MNILTWNSQGANLTQSILSQAFQGFPQAFASMSPDVIFIQEAGNPNYAGALQPAQYLCGWNPAPSFAYYQKIQNLVLSRVAYDGVYVPWQASASGNQRCSMSLLWQRGRYWAPLIDGYHDGAATHRPVFWVGLEESALNQPVGVFGCLHAPSGVSKASSANFVNEAMAGGGHPSLALAASMGFAGRYVLCGDFNINPGALASLLQPHTALLAPDEPTQQRGGTLDYLVHSDAWHPANTCAAAGNYVNSDHLEVRFM